jgi:outer membrane autotransporter protein
MALRAARKGRNRNLFASAAWIALIAASGSAQAGTYHATDDASLRTMITNADGDADPSATIILDNDITLANGSLPGTTKPITIDAGSHTLTSGYKNGGTLTGAVNLNGTPSGSIYIFNGNIQAATAGAGANGNGDIGLFANAGKTITINGTLTGGAGGGLGGNGGTGAGLTGVTALTNTGAIAGGGAVNGNGGIGVTLSSGASLTNSGTVRGGDGSGNGGTGVTANSVPNKSIMNSGTIQGGAGTTGTGGTGVSVQQGNGLDNSGTIIGGDGASGGLGVSINGLSAGTPTVTNSGTIRGGTGTAGGGGTGAFMRSGASLTNNGTVLGGNGLTAGSDGVDLGGPGALVSLTNNGTIRGGSGSGIGAVSGRAILVRSATAAPIVNTGTIEGGNGAQAILTSNAATNLNIVNSGTIRAGAGQANAIQFSSLGTTNTITLELQSGSAIQGNVAANSGVTNTFRLGGAANASFDVSTIGPQYQNFNVFEKTGTSTWTLTGTGSTATPWTISAGTLQMGNGSSMIGDVTNNAILAFDRSDAFTFANLITGTGGVTQTGTGRTILTAANTYTGSTIVSGGTLSVNGSIASSAVTVASGGTLGGIGTVGATTAQSGGTIAPGNSIGTLHISGAFTQNAGSVYQVEVDPNTSASDLIQVNGTATLQSGAGLNVVKNPPGEYRLGTVYTVLTASGGLSGTYAVTGETSGVSAFLGLRDSYDANNAYLTVVQTRDPVDAAQTPNQQAVAENLPGPVTPPVLNLPDDTSARAAFDQLSAQALASAKGALVSNGLYVRDMTLDRLRDVRCGTEENQNARNAACDTDHPSPWAQGFGGWGGISGNANASGLNHTATGMLAGFDLPIMDWRAGIFAGFSNSDFHLTGGPASGESTDYHLGAYAGTNWDQISLSLGASYTWNAIRTDRSVAFGTFTDRLQATYNAGVTQVFADAGYGMDMWGITLEPFANLAYLNLRTDDFTETGGAAALTSQADTIENVISTFGIRPSTTVDLGTFPVTLRGMAGWRHTFGTVTPTSTVAFSGGSNFTVSGAPIARDAMALEAGVDFAVADNISAGLTYGGQLSSRTTDQTARGTIRIAF